MMYQKLRELYEAGKTIDEIANEWEVSPSYIYLRLKKSGVTMRPKRVRPKPKNEELQNKIIQLREQGLSQRKIAETVGFSRSKVQYYLNLNQKSKI
ncbi:MULTISPECIES: hypothetical protein [unclassified Microcoleus]|uniref:hypothetical protein n=1 Tax=unclassified Microcoleus TaxID=2642155 RepID=UPI002FD38E06